MSCVDYKTWQAAKKACGDRMSVKGFGYVEMGRVDLRALRGLGDLNINTAAVTDLNDPCAVASLTVCPTFSTPPPYVPPTSSATPSSTASAVGGFSHWGLLAALTAGAAALYFATKKKSS